MTRDELIDFAGLRLGDNSTAFKAILDPFFDDIMRDLATNELLDALKQTNTFDTVLDQEDYSTQTMTGLSEDPIKIFKIRVPTWGVSGNIRQAESEQQYVLRRQAMTDSRGRFLIWRIYPNMGQIQFWPPVDADNAGVGIGEIHFLAKPTAIAGGTTITEVPTEDLDTLTWGVVARGAPFRDDSLITVDHALSQYEAGKKRIQGRIYSSTPTRVYPRDF